MILTRLFRKPDFILLNKSKIEKTPQDKFILYKIVDSYVLKEKEWHIVQCINTKAILSMSISDIVFDVDILYGLHPIQGCYVGIEYAKLHLHSPTSRKQDQLLHRYSTHRYGNNNLLYQNRQGFLGFECKITGVESLMDPRDLALSRVLIQEFDAAQAFCIGVLAGIRFDNSQSKTQRYNQKLQKNHLCLVGGSQHEQYVAQTIPH